MPNETPRLALNTFADGEEPWDHTDTVEALDELAIERGPIANRPASGEYPDALYLATDEQTIYRWDENASDWVAAADVGGDGGGNIATVTVASSDSSVSADFNADGTDDHVTINDAIGSLPASGGSVVLTGGQFNLGGKVTDQGKTNVTLTGQGRTTHLLLDSGVQVNAVEITSPNWLITNLRVDGNGENQTGDSNKETQNGIYVDNADNIFVKDCWVEHTFCTNIRYFGACENMQVIGNVCDTTYETEVGITRDSISLHRGGVDHAIITNNHCLNCGGQSIEISGAQYVEVNNNIIDNAQAMGINIHNTNERACEWVTCHGNVVRDSGSGDAGDASGIDIQGNNNTAVGNVVDDLDGNSTDGIRVGRADSDRAAVVGNVVEGVGGNGILVESPNSTIGFNILTGPGDHGIELLSAADNTTVGFNQITGATNQDIIDASTGTLIQANMTEDESGRRFYSQASEPANPRTNDIWFDI